MSDTTAQKSESVSLGSIGLQTIPEASSYSGRFHIELPIDPALFRNAAASPPPPPPKPDGAAAPPAGIGCLKLSNQEAASLPIGAQSRMTAQFWYSPAQSASRQEIVSIAFVSDGQQQHGRTLSRDVDGSLMWEWQGREDPVIDEPWRPLIPDLWYRIVIQASSRMVRNPQRQWVNRVTLRYFLSSDAAIIPGFPDKPIHEHQIELSLGNYPPEEMPPAQLPASRLILGHVRRGTAGRYNDVRIYRYWPSPSLDGDNLVGHWPLAAAPSQSSGLTPEQIEDRSGNKNHGQLTVDSRSPYVALNISGPQPASPATPPHAPTSPHSHGASANIDAIAEAAMAAKESGVLPAALFPYAKQPRTNDEKITMKALLAGLTRELVRERYAQGYQICICESAMSRQWELHFVPAGHNVSRRPRLLLILQCRQSSFPGRYGPGRIVHTLSLFPGERTTISIRSYRKTTTESVKSSSIFDSYTSTAAQDFESSLQDEQSLTNESDFTQSYYAKLEAEASWGWGKASGEAGGKWDIQDTTKQFSRSMRSASAKHAATASTNRNIEVNSSFREVEETEQTETIERTIQNINVSRTLNFVFSQLNQEILTLLLLTDMRIAYFDGTPDSVRELPLERLDTLLREVAKDDSARKMIQGKLTEALQSLTDYKGDKLDKDPAFFKRVGDNIDVDQDYRSAYRLDDTGVEIKVDGVILSVSKLVMRTDNVYVDSFLGQGDALDDYSAELQSQTNRARQLKNDRLELGIGLVRGQGNAQAAAAAFAQMFNAPVPSTVSLPIVPSVRADGATPVKPSLDGKHGG